MSTKKKTAKKKPTEKAKGIAARKIMVKNLSSEAKVSILHRVAAGESLREIAKDHNIRYASMRHVVFTTWKEKFPVHFGKFGFPMTMDQLKSNPPPKPVRPRKAKLTVVEA